MRSQRNQSVDWQQQFQILQAQAEDARLRSYYSEELPEQTTPLADAPLVALDLETTGLDPDQSEIVSIGLVPFSTQRVYLRDYRHWVVKPRKPMSEDSILIHGITHSDVESAPSFDAVFEQLLGALASKIVVVHCRSIEQEFLNRRCLQMTGETLKLPIIDTMEIERRALEGRRGALDKLLRRPLGSLRLADARKRYSLPAYQAHHALTDAIATAELLQAQLAYHYRPDTPVRDLWV